MIRSTLAALCGLLLLACGGGGGGQGDLLGDEARRAVLADLGEELILPALRDFDGRAQTLAGAVATLAAAPDDVQARSQAQDAWADAILSFQRIEVLQLGPAAMSGQPGGENLRDLIYAYPDRVLFQIDCRALSGSTVDAQTRIDAMGLGALEHLLFNPVDAGAASSDACGDPADPDQARADYARAVADFIASRATELHSRWEPAEGDFLAQWTQGTGAYMKPQDALDALSTALFYVEKDTKDRKIACPTGIGASGLVCNEADPTRTELFFSGLSAGALRANLQAFRDAFTGVNGGMGLNDLLRGIERGDIADRLLAALDATLSHLAQEIGEDFEGAVAAINDPAACTNASSSRQGEPAACALHGRIKAAMDIFRTEVVGALSLATPDSAAGDND